ncbi:hypothetical protein H8B02_07260 [Bradyrhizobium sp. Pear77]|nr:hypothetical protein [Bradyrhizobium altum]MCC8953269.1 hypothetical protein [Bradyrhizobium altum]
MYMMDWNKYRHQVVAGVGSLARLTPETIKGYSAMGAAGAKTANLDGASR